MEPVLQQAKLSPIKFLNLNDSQNVEEIKEVDENEYSKLEKLNMHHKNNSMVTSEKKLIAVELPKTLKKKKIIPMHEPKIGSKLRH